MVRPIPLLVLLSVGTALIGLSIPAVFVPEPHQPRQVIPEAGTANRQMPRQSVGRSIG